MAKRFWLVSLSILMFLTAFLAPTASAEMLIGAQLGYGSSSYPNILGSSVPKATEWTDKLWLKVTHDDLLFTGLYQGAHSFKGQGLNRTLAQVGANYQFFNESNLQAYGGLAYQFLNARITNNAVEGGAKSTFSGHGFAGQVVVDIPITDEIRTTATITGNPWTKWSFNKGSTTEAISKKGTAFVYQLDLIWDFSQELGAHLGLLGGSYSIPAFSYTDGSKEATKSLFTGVHLGVTHRF